MDGHAVETLDVAALRVFQPASPATALGLAVNYLMLKPAFANLRFGEWSRVLVGQINRRHYCFVIDQLNQVRGFAGWALTSRANAEAWVEGRKNLTQEESRDGECIVFNAWSAETFRIHRFMVDEARKLIQNRETMYFKRFYPNGTIRPVRLNVNDFVSSHIERRRGAERLMAGG